MVTAREMPNSLPCGTPRRATNLEIAPRTDSLLASWPRHEHRNRILVEELKQPIMK